MADEPEIFIDVVAEEVVALNPEQEHQVDPLQSGFTWYLPHMAAAGRPHSERPRKFISPNNDNLCFGGRDLSGVDDRGLWWR